MSVKSSQSGARMLVVLETIAAKQPVGASELSRHLGLDKSAVQRSIVTLSQAGWIAQTAARPVRWELSARFFTLAHLPSSGEDLRQRARRVLVDLRDRTGETAILAISDIERFVVIEVVESHHTLRMVPQIGQIIPPSGSATSRILLSHLDPVSQESLLGHAPSPEELAEFAANRERGYGLSVGEVMEGATTIAAPVFDNQGRPHAALSITGPSERLTTDKHDSAGALLTRSAAELSQRFPADALA